ncbi:hypothetical protein [Pseudomonas sp. B14(2017)]|uniref:hypothetical protein n=1 Tax=Pseudomonas sp. B14(2017) TaxID=1981745 RepID=UPI001C48441B|nr:hypothetical protein [Pseudomonas sp. B14(2017)]
MIDYECCKICNDIPCRCKVLEAPKATPARELTGGSVDYYTVRIEKPTNKYSLPYTAECNDIIEALKMNYAQGNAFKAIWRQCAAAALELVKPGQEGDEGLYDSQKVEFFGGRMVVQAKQRKEASHARSH